MVDAVPMVMQWPGERAMPSSTPCQSSSVILPARSSAQYFQVSEPEPSVWPFQLPRNMGPAGTKMVGRSIEAAPISNRSEEHTSELQSLMRISYAVFCLKKKKTKRNKKSNLQQR